MTHKSHHNAEAEDNERDDRGRFLSGNKGGGRPRGARSKLGEAFLEALAADFAEHGVEAIKLVRTRDVVAYTRIIAAILPREILSAAFNVTTVNINEHGGDRGFLGCLSLRP